MYRPTGTTISPSRKAIRQPHASRAEGESQVLRKKPARPAANHRHVLSHVLDGDIEAPPVGRSGFDQKGSGRTDFAAQRESL